MFSLDELADASRLVARSVLATPQLCWPLLCEAVGAEVWVKHENHTPIGAFKVGVVLSGGNIDAATLALVLAGRTPAGSG